MNTYPGTAVLPSQGGQLSWTKYLLWTALGLFVVIAGYAMLHHEPWGDEIHSWNIAKGSATYLDVIRNSRFEGHPPTWYTIMWTISKFTHNYSYVQLVHLMIATCTVVLFLFYSPLPLMARLLIPFGYYFLFEFAILSRNYAIGVLLAFGICLLIRQQFRYKMVCYYAMLLFLSNGHLFALILAGSLHLYFLLWHYEQFKNIKRIALHILLGLVFLLPALYFIFPPSQSSMNVGFWMDRWTPANMIITVQSPIRSFIPVPAWWDEHFWNTEFLMELQNTNRWLKYITPLLAIGIIAAVFFMLRKSRKSLVLFFSNLLVTACVSIIIFPLGCARYAGLIYIGFLAAWWLYCYEATPTRNHKRIANLFFIVQIMASIPAFIIDAGRPFSNFSRVNELVNKVPANEKIVADYWATNAICAFVDKPFYCLDLKKTVSFLLWDADMAALDKVRYRYCEGANRLAEQGVQQFWMLSTGTPEILATVDDRFAKDFRVTLVDQMEGAIEKGGNLYLYHITPFH